MLFCITRIPPLTPRPGMGFSCRTVACYGSTTDIEARAGGTRGQEGQNFFDCATLQPPCSASFMGLPDGGIPCRVYLLLRLLQRAACVYHYIRLGNLARLGRL